MVSVVAWFAFSARAAVMSALAFRSSWASTYDIMAFGFSRLSVSVLVYVVAWLAFSVSSLYVSVLVYVCGLVGFQR